MESNSQPGRSDNQSDSLPSKKQPTEKLKPGATKVPQPSQPSPFQQREIKDRQKEKEQFATSRSSSSSPNESRIDAAMRNQIHSSRGITVEIDTLRDMMPKLRKEVQTYSINECQLVKELEKKLPSSHEHEDVRINLVLEEIQRLRLNRRRTLSKLKESIVKIIELQSRMEMASYEAGEIFWNGRISRLIDSRPHESEAFAPLLNDKDIENFSQDSVRYLAEDEKTLSLSVDPTIQATKQSDQHLLTELARTVKEERAESKLNQAGEQKLIKDNPVVKPQIGNTTSSNLEQKLNQAPIKTRTDSAPSAQRPGESGKSASELSGTATQSGIDFEKAIAEAQKRAEKIKRSTRRGILMVALPVGIAVAVLIIESLTGIFYNSIARLFGG